jgi:two-component system, OmpR family, response regulator
MTRGALLDTVWDDAYENRSNVIDAHIVRLREKVDRPFGRRSLQTVRGVGYRLCDD